MRTVATCDQPAVRRDKIHEATKREFHCIKVAIDISVIEFDVVDDREFRQVVHELWTFVEVSGVVLVGFDDEIVTVTHTKTAAEILRDAADEKCGSKSTLIHHPRCDAGRGGLAVSAGKTTTTSIAAWVMD